MSSNLYLGVLLFRYLFYVLVDNLIFGLLCRGDLYLFFLFKYKFGLVVLNELKMRNKVICLWMVVFFEINVNIWNLLLLKLFDGWYEIKVNIFIFLYCVNLIVFNFGDRILVKMGY